MGFRAEKINLGEKSFDSGPTKAFRPSWSPLLIVANRPDCAPGIKTGAELCKGLKILD